MHAIRDYTKYACYTQIVNLIVNVKLKNVIKSTSLISTETVPLNPRAIIIQGTI